MRTKGNKSCYICLLLDEYRSHLYIVPFESTPDLNASNYLTWDTLSLTTMDVSKSVLHFFKLLRLIFIYSVSTRYC